MKLLNPSQSELREISLDGYIRMTFEAFARLEFNLRKSWEDTQLSRDLQFEGLDASCAGYCEWGTDAIRAVSIGWAWFDCPNGCRIIAPGGINSNVMLVAHRTKFDLGQAKTAEIIQAWLSTEHWAPARINRA